MANTDFIKTDRLILRQWQKEDIEPLQKLNNDPKVRQYFAHTKTYEESLQEYHLIQDDFKKNGWGYWAASLIDTGEFIGLIGLKHVDPIYSFAPAVEISWRIAFSFWGNGYATEGAHGALNFGFETLKLQEIVSYTTKSNIRSRNVMEKIGMQRDEKDDFDHPMLEKNHKLVGHVLYRLNRQERRLKNSIACPENEPEIRNFRRTTSVHNSC